MFRRGNFGREGPALPILPGATGGGSPAADLAIPPRTGRGFVSHTARDTPGQKETFFEVIEGA
jgi:hypothetical protein